MFYKILLPTLLIFLSCSQEQEERYLPKSTLAIVLADIELSQAIYKLHQSTHQINIGLITDEIYRKHGVNKEQFDVSFRFYAQSPKDIDEIYNEVIAILVRKQAEAK